ncbi:hypothetical protein NQ318_020536 [Aromia moschata]|uniref:Transposase n=1 Tax=Aromia moschata TaxID=1265417 RepID=A0AAV8Z1V4_9CUCU|nr:hypothetical protein NQ318_020536 [Aromia moschata]
MKVKNKETRIRKIQRKKEGAKEDEDEEREEGERFMLQNVLTDKIDELPLSYRTRMFFQQDGCPAHHAVTVRNWLNSEFSEHWIGRDGPILWPPRSPDLIILGFYL